MVAVGLAANGLGGRGSERSGSTSGVAVIVLRLGSLGLNASTGSLAVPVVAMGLTAGRLSRGGSKRSRTSSMVVVVIMLGLSGLGFSCKSRSSALAVP
jgi:hypothetical protein